MTYILIALIVLSGIFHYRGFFNTRFYPAQMGLFIFSVGVLGSYLLWKKNKYMGYLAVLFSLGFLKTYLGQNNVVLMYLYKEMIVGMSIFLLYYVIRELNVKENILKWFLIPVGLNILLIFIQKFDGNMYSFMPVDRVTGFLGNPSVVSTYIILAAPILLKYYPKFFPLLIIASAICDSRVPFIAMIASSLVYLWYTDKKKYKILLILSILALSIFSLRLFDKTVRDNHEAWIRERGSMIVGTLDGIKNNPILGWGIGTYEPIMQQIKEEDSYYLGAAFNAKRDYESSSDPAIYMNHPHNEYIYNCWNVGIGFLILLLLLLRDIKRKFTRDNILPFSILVGGMVLGLGYFFCYPVWFLLILALAIYHNQNKEALCKKVRKRK